MGRYASEGQGGGTFKQAPAGLHQARCFRIVDLGTQHGQYEGKPIIRPQIIVFWELPNECTKIDGKEVPFTISHFYTNSLGEKATLKHHLESWRGRPFTQEELLKFDLESILGAPCMLNVIQKNEKARVNAIVPVPKGTIVPPLHNTKSSFWLDTWNPKEFEELSDGLKKLIQQSDEYKEFAAQKVESKKPDDPVEGIVGMDDDIPF